MNNQEAFNKIWERAKDRREAFDDFEGSCMYRCRISEEETIACFVGALIPDELYDPAIERLSVKDLVDLTDNDLYKVLKPIADFLGGVDVKFLSKCQNIHDAYNPREWEGKLRAVAKEWDLEVPKD